MSKNITKTNINALTVDNTTALKGIMAIIIVIAHLRNNIPMLNDTYIGSLLTSSGYLIVGMFFFLTGYGLCESYKNKENYYNTFFKNRIVTFYFDCIIFCAIYCIYYLFIGKEINFQGIVTSIFCLGQGSYISNGWYLQVAGYIYICFFIIHKLKIKNSCYAYIYIYYTLYTVIVLLNNGDFTQIQHQVLL